MKKLIPFSFVFALLLVFNSCSDKVEITRSYTVYEPVFMSPQALREAVIVADPVDIEITGKIYLYKNFLLINEPGKGIHLINNVDPSNPQPLKFINIPGNFDMAIKGDMLYADSYVDLVVFDISDINKIEETERLEEIFLGTNQYYYDLEKGVIVAWEEVEKIVVSEDEYGYYPAYFWYDNGLSGDFMAFSEMASADRAAFVAPSSTGVGGSMARFTIVNNHLYSIDNSNLYTFNISDLRNPQKISSKNIGWGIETIFPYKENLFLGSQTGMHIYGISDPDSPEFVSIFQHVRRCDPVIVQDTLAYVTLRGGDECGGFTNQLDVVNIKDLTTPYLIKTYPMQGPYGLGIDGNTLFVCDGTAGLKVYDASDVYNIDKNHIKTYSDIDAYDVIPFNNLLIMIGKDGVTQFDYSNPKNIIQLSHIDVKTGS